MKYRNRAAALLAALVCLSACASETTPAVTDDAAGTGTTEAITEAVTTEAVTEAVTEASIDESTLYLDELANYVITPKPIRRENDPVNKSADYNKPKVKLDEIVEGLIAQGTYVGKDGWFFYKDCIDDYQGTNLYSDTKLALLGKMLQKRADWCAENGMTFYFFIAPNKATIYPEKMMDGIEQGDTSRMDQIYDYLKNNTTVNVIDARDALKAAKAETTEDLYYPLDTHWNANGAFVAYQVMMDEIQKTYPTAKRFEKSDYQIDWFDSYFKDMAYYLGWYDTLTTEGPVYTKRDGRIADVTYVDDSESWGQFVHEYVDPETGERDSVSYICYQNKFYPSAPKAYFIHDSFGISLNDFFRDSFSECTSLWSTEFYRSDILDKAPDVVIFECVEATLDNVFGAQAFSD